MSHRGHAGHAASAAILPFPHRDRDPLVGRSVRCDRPGDRGIARAFDRPAAGEDRAIGNVIEARRCRGGPSVTAVPQGGGAEPYGGDPSEGVAITAADVLVRRGEVERFERQYGFFNGLHVPESDGAAAARRRGGPGVPPRHDWDAFYAALARRIHEYGVPATQAELVREMVAWFEARDAEHAPDESTIRKKITPVWGELSRA